MKNWPLRRRLTLWTVIVGGLSVAVFGAVVALTLKQVMLAQFDAAMKEEAEELADAIEQAQRPVNWADQRQVTRLFSSVISLHSFEIEQPRGQSVYRTRSLGGYTVPPGPEGQPYTATIGTIEQARVLQVTRGTTVLRVAVDLAPLRRWVHSMWLAYAILVPVSAVMLWMASCWLYGRAMKPVDELAAAAERITAQRLDQRLPAPSVRDEIGKLTEVLNRMIVRLHASFVQTRRFSADASHELKTPLTILRGELEGLLRSGELHEPQAATIAGLLDEVGRLMHIVEGLLLLSQADSGRLQIGNDNVDMSALVQELQDDIEILAERDSLRLALKLEPGVRVKGSPQFLRQVVLNLYDNAIKYNRPGGTVRAELFPLDGSAVFRIANTGDMIPAAQRERVFDRFYRMESARPRPVHGGGQGLGLSICREIIRAHGGTLSVEPSEPGWSVFQFTLPLAEKAESGMPSVPGETRV